MRGRLWMLLVAGLTVAAGAGEAQAATVYMACDELEGCHSVFTPERRQVNDVTLTGAQVGPFSWQDSFEDSRSLVRPPVEGGIFLPTGYPEPSLEDTFSRCEYNARSATCDRDGRPWVYLGDMNDTATTAGLGYALVYGEAGNDTLRTSDGDEVRFIGGPGGDTLIGPGWLDYPEGELGLPLEVDMRFDVDGVADDGRPGEGDNIRPGHGVFAELTGDHVFVGHDGTDEFAAGDGDHLMQGLGGDDVLVTDGTGSSRLEGGAGNDRLVSWLGTDTLVGGPGIDRFDGPSGNQTIQARDGEVDERIDCGAGVDTAYVDVTEGPIVNCETVIPG